MKEDILDRYVLQILSDSDKIWLQKALKADPSFQKELDSHLEIVRGIEIHTEKLFDAAFVELNTMADEALQKNIDEVETSLETEGFFTQTPTIQPIIDKKPPFKEEKKNEIITPNNPLPIIVEKTQIAPKKELLKENTDTNITNPTTISPLYETPKKEDTKTVPQSQKDWVKIIAILLVILLTILLLWQNL